MLSKTEEKFEVDLELNVEIKLEIRFETDMKIELTSLPIESIPILTHHG